MLLKSLISCVHPEVKARFPGFFTFFRGVFSTDIGICSQRGSVIFELCKCVVSLKFALSFEIEDGKPF